MSDAPLPISLAERLRRAQLRVAAVALLAMMMVPVADVVLRYVVNRPISGSYDLVESALVVFVFNGLSSVFLNRQNIVIDLIDSFAGRRTVAALVRLSDLLSLAMLVVLFWAMTGPALQAFAYGDRKLELGLPIYLLWVIALIGIAGAVLCVLALFARRAGPSGQEPQR